MKKFVFAAAALAAAAPALAQPAPADTAFSGPYVGAQLGWQQDKQTLRLDTGNLESFGRQTSHGFRYGGQLGYDFRLSPNFVAGVEVAASGRTGSTDLDNGDFEGAGRTRLSTGRTFDVTGRLGYLVGPSSLVYARGGYSNTQFRLSDGVDRVTEDRDGYTVGVGYEQYLSRRVSARVEYNYGNYGKDNLPFLADSLGADRARLEYERHAVTAGVNFRF